ncbi:MAG TPA: hypothetical protein PLK76_03700 [bacterium]|nr:hypothetical protein [bacterium]
MSEKNFSPDQTRIDKSIPKIEKSPEEIGQMVLRIAEEQAPSSMEVGVLRIVREVVQEILDKKIAVDFSDEKYEPQLVEVIRERLKEAGIKIINSNVASLEDFTSEPGVNPETKYKGDGTEGNVHAM